MFGKYILSFGILFFFILCLIGCERIKNPLIVSSELFAEPQWAMWGGNVRHTGNVNTPAYDGIIGPTDSNLVKVQWVINIQDLVGALPESHPVAGDDGIIYITTHAGLVAINSDGTLKWLFNGCGSATPAIGDDGTVYFHNGTGYLYALNPEDASIKWQTLTYQKYDNDFANTDWMDIVVLPQKQVALIGDDSLGKKIVCVNGYNGTILWQTYFEKTPQMSLWITGVADDGTIYVNRGSNSPKNILYALSPNGSTKWSFSTDRGGADFTGIDQKGNIYYGNYIVSPEGQMIKSDIAGVYLYPVLWYDRYFTTYVRFNPFTLFCYDSQSDMLLWKKKYIDDSEQSCVVDKEGNVFVFSGFDRVYSYNKDGNFLWNLELKIGFINKPLEPTLTSDGAIVVTGYWHRKVALIK